MKRNFLFVCNFKMNIVSLVSYQKVIGNDRFSNIVLCPNFCDIEKFCALKQSSGIMIGAQNVSEYFNGAHTGEVSATMLKSAGADFCIVGHSERKQNNFETLSQTNLKVKSLINAGLTPIICVGEDLLKDEEFATRYVLNELNQILQDVDISKVIVAYEPIWAIGTGKVPSTQHIKTVVSTIKQYTGIEFVLYGGSFNESNFGQIISIDCVDGALIGGASLKPDLIVNMVKKIDDEYDICKN